MSFDMTDASAATPAAAASFSHLRRRGGNHDRSNTAAAAAAGMRSGSSAGSAALLLPLLAVLLTGSSLLATATACADPFKYNYRTITYANPAQGGRVYTLFDVYSSSGCFNDYSTCKRICDSYGLEMAPQSDPQAVDAVRTLCATRSYTCWLDGNPALALCYLMTAGGAVVKQGCDQPVRFVCRQKLAPANTTCPEVPGYALTPNVDHFGDDINCQPTATADVVAGRCNGDAACKAFNTYLVGSTAWACTKSVVSPVTPSPGICFYTKIVVPPVTPCPNITGYTVTPGVDHFGDDINCQPTATADVVAGRCNGDAACKAFNTYFVGSTAWACTKTTASPVTAVTGICFYTKNGNGNTATDPGPNTCSGFTPPAAGGRVLFAQNRCNQTVSLTALSNAGLAPFPTPTLFPLAPGACVTLQLPGNWAGRLYGQVGCVGSTCLPGPFTLAEVTFNGFGGLDYYDISLVDGFNLPIGLQPITAAGALVFGTGRTCTAAGCPGNVLAVCPPELQVRAGPANAVVACASACTRFGSPQYCCSGAFSCGPQCCPPTAYSLLFSAQCPFAYSYAYDDRAATFTCPTTTATGGYQLNFCF